MSILTPNDFNGGEQNIAGLENVAVQETVQDAIDKYEKRFLKELLGVTLANEFIAGLEVLPTPDPKWISLRDETDLKEMLKYYVWFYYTQYQITVGSGTGEVKPKNENSTNASVYPKMVYGWNQMVELNRVFDLSTTTYPDYVRPHWRRYDWWFSTCEYSEIYYFKNRYGL